MKTLSVIAMFLMMTSVAWAACPEGRVPASCRDGSLRCCMPAGRVDCGNGTNNISKEACDALRLPPGAGEGIPQRAPAPAPEDKEHTLKQ